MAKSATLSGQEPTLRETHHDRSPFAALGALVVRFRWPILVLWIVVTVVAARAFPSLSSVSNNDNSSFLPKSAPSIRAAQLALPFERANLPTAVIVAVRSNGPLTSADQAAVTRAESSARQITGVLIVRDQGISGDGQARKALIAVSGKSFQISDAEKLVDRVRAVLASSGAPAGLSLHLSGELATLVDNQRSSNHTLRNTQLFSVLLILVLLFLIFRSVLAPLITLIPAGLVLVLSGYVIGEASKAGVQVSDITQIMLSVLILGAGTDYGLFLVFRVREELQRGLEPRAAVIKALSRVGESITFSAATVIVALLCLLLATLGFYKGLGPALAIGIAIMLLAGLTLLPALLAILGRAAFWPTKTQPGTLKRGIWGRIAGRIVRNPIPTLLIGLVAFGALALVATGYSASGFGENGTQAANSDSTQGTSALQAHFPAAQVNPTNVLFTLATSVWQHPATFELADQGMRSTTVFKAISGPLEPNGAPLTPAQLVRLHQQLGPAVRLPLAPPPGVKVSPRIYNAYRATAQFISPDGRTLQFYTTLRAGAPDSTTAMQSMPSVRDAVTRVAATMGATESGVAGQAAASYDVSNASNTDLIHIVPIVLLCIAILLALVLRSLIAPIYLIISVGISYLAAIGLAVIVFMKIGHGVGLNFILPFLMFIFLMALGEDYNILVMSRIREEAHHRPLTEAVVEAVGATGTTVTSAGLILAGTFLVLTISGTGQIQQIGFSIFAGILLDTFLVRTLLVPSTVVLLGRWNWWPSKLTMDSPRGAS